MASGGRENVFSSDEEDLPRLKKRSKRPKAIVTSDSDSDSDKDFDKRRRKNVRPLDLDSDESDNKYNNETRFSNETRVCSNSNEDSSLENDLSDNEQSEKCAICLGKFAGQDIATPEACDHMFCLECLREWAKNVNTCPIDRLKFNLILVRDHKEDKICKRISVNSPDSPWHSESESESIFSSETAFCASCREHDDLSSLFSCQECEKAFHARCLTRPSFNLLARSGICPDCAISISLRRFRSERLRLRRAHSPNVDNEISFYRRSYNMQKRLARLLSLEKARMEREIAHISRLRRQISSSESSDEDIELTSHSTQQHWDRLSSRSQCPLLQKRHVLHGRIRNQTLISTAASATSNSELYSVDSDDTYNEYGYENQNRELSHDEPSSSTRSPLCGQPRTKIVTTSERENYDLVGSILQTQTLILRPDVIKLQRDGTVLLNSDLSPKSTVNSSASSSSRNEERLIELPSFSNSRSIMPHTDGITYKQQPLNPTQNSNSKYRETGRENYTCTSSTSKEPSIDCDSMSISSRNAFQNSGNERYNDNSCSSMTHKSFCSSSTTEDIKKMSNFKESNKVHHSEDEVDIYSDIESVGDDEGVCTAIEAVGDRIEPMEMAYKGDQSPSSNPEATSDSSDNELVIDEDMAAEEESENRKENNQINNIRDKCENEQVNESEESNVSCSNSFSEQQKNTPDVQDNSSCVDSRSVDDCQLGEESSQETFHSGGNGGYKADSECDESKYGSECDESKNGSEYEENKNDSECEENKNDSECEENRNESECEENINENEYEESKNGSEYGDEKNRSEDDDNNVSVTEENKNVSEYDEQESDMDVQVYDDNSVDSSKKSPRAETITPCSTISSPKQYDEEMKGQESLDQCDNSISSGVQEFDDVNCRKESGNADASLIQTNENTSGSFSQVEENENYQNENNSNLSFESSQNVTSEPEEAIDSNIDISQTFSEGDKKLDDQNEIKSSDYNNDEKENEVNDVDFSENASTPCLDENIDGQIEDSPVHNDTVESIDPDFKMDVTKYDPKSFKTPPSGSEYEMVENDEVSLQKTEEQPENHEKTSENAVDLGIEDISEAGSGDLDDDFADEHASFSQTKEQVYNDTEREDNANYEFNDVNNVLDSKVNSKHSDDAKYQNSSHSNQSFEEREEGEIIEDKPVRHPDHKRGAKFERYHDDNEDYGDLPRVNISDLPRIPKIKRDKKKESIPEELPVETKRTSVLGRVDLGGGDISWKRLSKHTRERSYRDGRPKEEKVLYRERESRKKDNKYSSDNEWRSDSKSSRRDDSKKDTEKLRSEYDSRSRKNDRKESKASDWDYSDRDKRNKSHKDKHKDKHRDKKEKTKHDKNKHSKDEVKYSRNRSKDDRYDRELKLEKEQRFERVVHEKGKCKDKDHKSKHKDRKNENKSVKDHSREKHKHIYVSDHFSEKQREREVRKIDDKLKIVVEQKEGRKEKSKHKDKKESKHEKKQIHHHEHRKKEIDRSPYTELTSIESKEIFAKGDSIIINVSFNRTNSPKDINVDNTESSFKDKKSEDFEIDDVASSDKSKKHSLGDKAKNILDTPITKRPATPPERTNPVLSVSECYWQGGEDSDANSADSEKSVIEITNIEEENDTMESADPLEGENFSNSFNSNDATESQTATKETVSESDKTPEKIEKIDNSFVKESEILAPPPKRRSPRSPSPPSPADNDSYDPCEPTRSPSPPPMPPAPPLPTGNPKPPPSPELPPLPPEPEPIDNIREETVTHKPSEFAAVSSVVTSSQPVTVNTQPSVSNPISMPSMLLPPPSFMSHTSSTTNSLPSLTSLLPPNFSFQVNSHPNVIFQSNHVQQVIRGIVPSQMHATSAIPPPPNPPSLPHMGSVPPPPPPPSAMALISQVRHPQMNVRPTITPNQILQNLTMGHTVSMPQMQLTHLHHLPPSLSNALNNHQSPMMIPSQNQSLNIPVSIQNQPVSRVILSQNQMLNHSVSLQNQNTLSKPQSNVMSHQFVSNSTQKSEKATPEKTEVIDMDVDSPYSPGDSPSMDSVCDYSPTCSPLPSSPKTKDIFDSLLPTDHRTSERKIQDMLGKAEKSKRSKNESDTPNKRAKHEHKRHSVRMQLADKNKSRREQRIEKKLDDSQLKILDELPSSAVEMQVKEKFLKKLNRQERVVEEVKLVLKPYYKTRDVTKEEYKDILRKSVPKICHNKSGEINPVKVKSLIESYVKKIKHSRKKSDKKKSSKLS